MTNLEKQWPEFNTRKSVIQWDEVNPYALVKLYNEEYAHCRKCVLAHERLITLAEMGWFTARALLIKPGQDCAGVISDSLKKIEEMK